MIASTSRAVLLGKRKSYRATSQVQIVNGKLVVRSDEGIRKKRRQQQDSEESESGSDSEEEYQNDTSEGEDDESEAGPSNLPAPKTVQPRAKTPQARVSRSRSASTKPKVRYYCTWEGCDKSYAKPVRLTEHLRSHTGERPFKCTFAGCESSYLRDTHLQAHMRSHAKDDQEKPLACSEEGCEKRFWTNQHLKRHIKLVHEQDKGAYQCTQCSESFNKNHKLRSHVAQAHMPEGTNPFICTHEGCDRSFKTGSKLRTHAKIHDENRYVCMHASHTANGESPPKFANWSALQVHNKTEHPPICDQPGCEGKVFANNKALKKHCIKWHLDGVSEKEQPEHSSDSEEQSYDSQEGETDSTGEQAGYSGAFEEAYVPPVARIPASQTAGGSSYEDLIDPDLL